MPGRTRWLIGWVASWRQAGSDRIQTTQRYQQGSLRAPQPAVCLSGRQPSGLSTALPQLKHWAGQVFDSAALWLMAISGVAKGQPSGAVHGFQATQHSITTCDTKSAAMRRQPQVGILRRQPLANKLCADGSAVCRHLGKHPFTDLEGSQASHVDRPFRQAMPLLLGGPS